MAGKTELINDMVIARGTADGLILRLNGENSLADTEDALRSFLGSRKNFLAGSNSVVLEWYPEEPHKEILDSICDGVLKEFDLTLRESRVFKKKQKVSTSAREKRLQRKEAGKLLSPGRPKPSSGLFAGMEDLGLSARSNAAVNGPVTTPDIWDNANTKLVFQTLRSGQRLESEHSIVLFGDVNSGAEVVAGGDVIVLGCLRGVAHAGAYDETGGGKFIFALSLRPTQLRIGSVITRGSGDEGGKQPEIALVGGSTVVVEPYEVKNVLHLVKRRS